jgi:SH3 domain protein
MSIRSVAQIACVLAGVFLAATAVQAQTVWVSDQFEITLRTGPSTTNAIELMLGSGTRLEVLERDADSGYSRVRTAAGTEGWVLTRYLMGEPPAREQLETLTSQLTDANSQGSSMTAQLQAIRTEQQNATRQIRELQTERDRLQSELEEVTRVSANVLSIDSQNKNLREQLADAEIKVGILEEENESLRSQEDRKWFIIGALVLSIGIIVGLVLPRIKFRRRSRYDRL